MDGELVPEKVPLGTHLTKSDYQDGIWALVAVDLSRLSSESRRVSITTPARVLVIVDAAAVREGESRSGLLVRSALGLMERMSEDS